MDKSKELLSKLNRGENELTVNEIELVKTLLKEVKLSNGKFVIDNEHQQGGLGDSIAPSSDSCFSCGRPFQNGDTKEFF
ncbi:hypothetical protein BBI11_12955 [Planococcus maritimus]|uniref:hypothetical protein n=1 Tax=Planococcus maritimus TaxID=192421 RepID=UPI00080EF99A|nr:hypothetical protein [Planococcus maritimus]ANU17884.1 hypothetical protein BBI11_12955 [Planococcus maritimus]